MTTEGRPPRRPSLRVVTVLVATAALTSSCGAIKSGVKEAPALAGQLRAGVDDAATVAEFGSLAVGSEGLKRTQRSLDDLLRQAPPKPSSDLQAAIDDAVRAQSQLRAVAEVDAAAAQQAAALPAAVDEVAAQASANVPQMRQQLGDIGQGIATDIACDVIWDGLLPSEKKQTRQALTAGTVKMAYRDTVGDHTVEAVSSAAQKYVLRRVSLPAARLVDWGSYGKGILDKAGQVSDAMNGTPPTLTVPSGSYTRAAYVWARVCLKPPG